MLPDGRVDVEEMKRMTEDDKSQQRLPLLVVLDTDEQPSHPLDAENATSLQQLCSYLNGTVLNAT